MPLFGSTSTGDNYKDQTPFEKRVEESSKIRDSYPDRIPCIVEKSATEKVLPPNPKRKYLVQREMPFAKFRYVVQSRLKLSPEKALFIFVNNTLPAASMTMDQIYEQNKDKDGFLYVTYASENTFGNEE